MSTNEYVRNVKSNNWQRFDEKLFQRNYYEHIIRDEKSYLTITDYIINNPKNWKNDSINPTNEKKK
jgi:putative transposase